MRVEVDGTGIHVEVSGVGPWLTLLHGFSQDGRLWDAVTERLAARFRLVRIDLRGHGRSDAPPAGYGPREYAGDVLGVLDALGIAATHLWGTHTGAAVGLLLAIERPERVASLVLEGAVVPGRPLPSVEEWQARARRIAREQGRAAAIEDWLDHAPFFAGLRAEPERHREAAHRAIVRGFAAMPWLSDVPALPQPDLTPALSNARQPALLVNGGADLPEFLALAAELERALPAARRVIVPAAGAFPAWEEPDAVAPLVAAFLEDVD